MLHSLSTLLIILLVGERVFAFSNLICYGPLSGSLIRRKHSSSRLTALNDIDSDSPIDKLSEERKSNLFQFLLRDLEVEGVPLLGCDADQVHTFQAAVWTIMAELSEKDAGEKACLVLESIPVEALKTFADDFVVLKTQNRLIDKLPELKRISVSLLGKGVGPALIIETSERSEEDRALYAKVQEASSTHDENKYNAAMKSFVDRMVVGLAVCPFMKSNNLGPVGLADQKVEPGPIAYRTTKSADVCDIISAFWNCVCEMLSVPENQLSSTVLSYPTIGMGYDSNEVHDRFSAVAELTSRSLFLYRGGDVFDLLHMHPLYDRNLIYPESKPAHGHLPPTGWLRPMLKHNGNDAEAIRFSEEDLNLHNYQRRSPVPAVVIKRVSQLDAATTPESGIVKIETADGTEEIAAGVPTYSRNVIKLASEGRESLQAKLDSEAAIVL